MPARKISGKTASQPPRKTASKTASKTAAKTVRKTAQPGLSVSAGRAQWKTLTSNTAAVKVRIAALSALGWVIADDRASYRIVLALVTDRGQAAALRAAALAAVQSVSFDALRFPALRPDYLRSLRMLSDDPDLELRQRALGMLMRDGDAPTQQRLLAGLKEPAQALLSPEKTLQLLSYDLHGETYEVARDIVAQPPNALARREALRLLAADPASAPLFERIVQDKTETSEVRRLSASALHQLAPQRLQALARKITLDDEDDDELRTACLVALTQFGDSGTLTADAPLQAQASKLVSGNTAAELGQAAQDFVGRYGKR